MAPIADLEYFRLPPRWLFVKITDTEGRAGWGEATLEGHSLAVEATLTTFRTHLLQNAPSLDPKPTSTNKPTAFEADNIEQIFQSLYRQFFYRGGPVLMSAISGIDIALWDLKARKLNTPIHQLLGGPVRSQIKVYSWIGGDTARTHSSNENGAVIDNLVVHAKQRYAQGFRAVKMIPTGDIAWLDTPSSLSHVLSRVRAVQECGLAVALDFHGRLHQPMARQLLSLLSTLPTPPLFVEEPLLSEHPDSIAALHAHTAIPIALGERTYNRWHAKPFLCTPTGPAIDILQPDVSHCGGISELHKLATLVETFDVAIAPHCPLGPLALAACVQVDCCVANFGVQEMSVGIHYNAQRGVKGEGAREGDDGDGKEEEEDEETFDIHSYIKTPEVWTVKEGGYIDVPRGPGLGVEVDEEMVRRVSKRFVEYGKPWEVPRFWGRDGEVREW